MNIASTEPLPKELLHDAKLKRTRLGEFLLCIPEPLEVRAENQSPDWKQKCEGIIALDPGVRTFMTGYSPSGLAVEWGKADVTRIYRLCYAMDKLQSKWSQHGVRHRERYKMQRAARRIRRKIRNIVDEAAHKKLAKWLALNYHTVLLPEFATSRMVRHAKRKIGNKTARAMLTWSHYRFRRCLENKIREYPWCRVHIVDEHYTVK